MRSSLDIWPRYCTKSTTDWRRPLDLLADVLLSKTVSVELLETQSLRVPPTALESDWTECLNSQMCLGSHEIETCRKPRYETLIEAWLGSKAVNSWSNIGGLSRVGPEYFWTTVASNRAQMLVASADKHVQDRVQTNAFFCKPIKWKERDLV